MKRIKGVLLAAAAAGLLLATPSRPAGESADFAARKDDAGRQAAWEALPDAKKARILKVYEKWKELPSERREELRKKYARFMAMSPERRAELRVRWARFQAMPEKDRRALIRKFKKWKNLPDSRREELRRKYRRDRRTERRRGGAGRGFGRP